MKSTTNPTIIAIAVAMLCLAGCKDKKDSSALDVLNDVQVVKKPEPPKAAVPTRVAEPVQAPTAAVANPPADPVAPPTKRAASYPRNDASISNQVAIAEIEAGRPYTSIVAEVEGFRARPYSDVGQGFAVGYGWNMSFQSAKNNRSWATKAGIAEPMIKSIVAINGRMQGQVPTGIEITPAQATTVAQAMRPTFEQPAIKLFGQGAWSKLQEHQKAVLVYHVEKVGPGGAAKYKGLIKAVQTYANNPTEANAQAVVSHISYGYKIKYPDGSFKQMYDTRSQLYMGALFVDPQQYRYLLGKVMAPKGFATTAKTVGFSIDTAKPAAEQVETQDKFHTEIEQLADNGYVPEVKQTVDGKTISYSMQVPVDAPKPAEAPKVQGSCKPGMYEETKRLPDGSD